MRPGTELEGTIDVVNEGSASVTYTVGFKDLSVHPNRSAAWIKLDTKSIELGASGRESIAYTISVPETATGEFHGRLSFAEGDQQRASGMVGIQTQISVPIFVVVQGTELYSIEIVSFRLKTHRMSQAEVVLRNTGNVHLRAKGECEIRLRDHEEIECTFTINEQGFPVYPGQDRALSGRLPRMLDSGTYIAGLRFSMPGGQPAEKKAFVFDVKEWR